ncbi:MAG: ABC-F family ATP-binding cassette domain-containing protein [Candidatus Zixiibacteriota bacterium]|nr:MAG: ABC-F family ATP-binding cassette domain-containing protein [candidate division Zixibacteria bacterium]
MSLIAAERISKRFGDQVLFERVSFTVQHGDRIGLVGKNGSGKTTLFEILAGLKEADSGSVNRSRGCLIEYAQQEQVNALDTTLLDFVSSARRDLLQLRREIAELEEHLAVNPSDRDKLTRLGHRQHEYEAGGGFDFDSEVKHILMGLSFPLERHRDRIRNFSGGEKNRAALARVLAGKGNLLLLDEPTNHLDIESTCWLEDYLSRAGRSYIVVSHDRTFLQNTVDIVWEIHSGKIDAYTGSFEKYLEQRSTRRRQHEHQYRLQREEIKRVEEFIRRNMAGQKTKQAQSRLKYLQRIKRLPPPEQDGRGPSIRVKSSGRSYAHVLAVEDMAVGYGRETLVEDISFDVYRGDKIGLIGPNGSGKSTILRTLIGEVAPIRGDIKLGNNVDVVYFDQELSDLTPDRTVLENVWEMDPQAEMGTVRSFLGRFGFTGNDSLKMVAALSGGEKTKLSLARLLYHPANFIIFDEPTNHLDLISREALEEALIEYSGSLLIVSHDRYFLDRVVTRIMHIDKKRLTGYDGNYSYFREKTAVAEPAPAPKPAGNRLSHLEFKKKSRYRSRVKKEITSTRSRIADVEKEIERLGQAIDREIPRSDWEKLAETTRRKTGLEEELLRLYQKLEELSEIELD